MTPALLTRISILPKCSIALATALSTDAWSVTSTGGASDLCRDAASVFLTDVRDGYVGAVLGKGNDDASADASAATRYQRYLAGYVHLSCYLCRAEGRTRCAPTRNAAPQGILFRPLADGGRANPL